MLFFRFLPFFLPHGGPRRHTHTHIYTGGRGYQDTRPRNKAQGATGGEHLAGSRDWHLLLHSSAPRAPHHFHHAAASGLVLCCGWLLLLRLHQMLPLHTSTAHNPWRSRRWPSPSLVSSCDHHHHHPFIPLIQIEVRLENHHTHTHIHTHTHTHTHTHRRSLSYSNPLSIKNG